ncbi:hypothetical protein KY361_05665 [Candidatus Woesearchaeota archaeon]|nr:hypothetical protein [Candidatus Woesearchaeota archaeon]
MNKKIKRGLAAIIYLIIFISIIKMSIATVEFDPTPPTKFDLNEDEFWSYDVNVSCDEGSVEYSLEDNPYSNLSIDSNTGVMTFIPTNDDVGWNASQSILIIVKNVSDPILDYDTSPTRFNISNVNDPPNITGWYPTNLNISTYENVSGGVFFSINATDIDIKHGDSLNVSWLLDGILKKNETDLTTQSDWTFYPGFADAGIRNVTAVVADSESAKDSVEWRVDVNDSNRPPVFNKTIQDINWYEGNNNTNNISLHEHFYDLDYIEGTNNLTFGYILHGVYGAWNSSMNITISINQTTGNVSFFTPHPDWFGAEIVQFYANDSFDITYANNITVNITNINDPPVLECLDNQTLAIEVLFTTQASASDIDSAILYFSDNSTLFDIGVNTGVISFTPNSTDEGVYNINISVNDSELSDSCIVVFNIIDNEKPVLANISNTTAWESSYFEMNVTATDADQEDNLTFSDNSAMFDIITTNSSASNAIGLINFTPVNANVGNHTITITVTDSKGAADSKTFNLEVRNINNPPYFTTIPAGDRDVRVNFAYTLDMRDYTVDLDNDVLNFTSNSSIFNITVEGIISVTLNSSFVGTYDVNITAVDGAPEGINSTIVTFTVSINQYPRINATFFAEGREDIQFNLNLGATDPDGDDLTFTDNTDMFDVSSSGTIQFTPLQQHIGYHTIEINVTDPYDGFNSTILYLNITEENDAPYFVQLENKTLEEETTYIIYIIAYDEDGYFPLNFGSDSSMFTIESYNDTTGRINFTPDDPDVGTHTINFWVNDSIVKVYATAVYNISGINDPPIINSSNPPANYTIAEGSSQLFDITIHDPDTSQANISHEWYKDGILQKSGSNTTQTNWTFTPGYCDARDYNITIIVRDPLESDSHTWNITVNNTNRVPTFNATIPDLTWRQPYNRTNNFSLKDYTDDPDFECNGSQKDSLTYGYTDNVNIDIGIDQNSGNVSFYIDSDWFGIENVRFSANDSYDLVYSSSIMLNVTQNFAPTIDQIYPYGNETFDNATNITTINTIFGWVNASLFPNGTKINISENTSIAFNQQSSDQNPEDSISYQWLLDGAEQVIASSWTFDIGFNDSGIRNVTLTISDGFKQDSFYWNVTIKNENIGPSFGRIGHTLLSDFSGGTTNRTNITVQQGNITLSMQNSTDYYPNGTFISPAIDFNDDNLKPNLRHISWSDYTPSGTTITLQTRISSDSSSWSNWSNVYTNSTQSQILNFTPPGIPHQQFHDGIWDIWNNRYLQYKVNFLTPNTSITPILRDVTIYYEVSDFESDEDVTLTDWIDLDDYFNDADGETLIYNYSGAELENFDYITITNGVVGFKPANDWYGIATIRFSAADPNNYTTYSNNITLTIVNTPDEETIQTRTVTTTVTKPRPVPVREPAFLELIVPGPLIMGPEETIIAPILLQNKGETILNGIRLRAVTEEEGVILKFAEEYFPVLDIGQTINTELYISTEGRAKAGTYSITVIGEVEDPALEDTAIITVSVLENMTERINAVSDFLQLYPECLELNELIVQARKAIEQGRNNEAIRLLDEAVEGCKYLVSTREEVVTAPPKTFKLNVRWASITAGAWILLLLIIHLITVITRRRAMRHKPE